MNNKGFTLVEILVSLAIFSVISVVSIELFRNSVIASNKSRITDRVRQDGQVLMSILEARIRNAKSVNFPLNTCTTSPDCCSNPAAGCTVCESPGTCDSELSTNPPEITVVDLSGNTARFVCESSRVNIYLPTPPPAPQILSNTNSFYGVNVTNCSFDLIPKQITDTGSESHDVININLTVEQARTTSKSEFTGAITLNKTVVLRN